MPKLHFSKPEFVQPSCDLPDGKTTVGRSPRNNLVLSDPSVSADHGELLVCGNEVIVCDHGSSNGTWVAGARVDGQLPAKHGDLIRFGRIEARLELDEVPDGDATAVTATFAAARAARVQPGPDSPREIIGSGPPTQGKTVTTVSVPAPAKPAPPAIGVTSQPSLSKPNPPGENRKQRWQIVALVVVVIVTVAWLLRTFR
jgi:predicted component of type VI protein secretion system